MSARRGQLLTQIADEDAQIGALEHQATKLTHDSRSPA